MSFTAVPEQPSLSRARTKTRAVAPHEPLAPRKPASPTAGPNTLGGVLVMDKQRKEAMDRLEHRMLEELGLPVQVSWSFRLNKLVVDRRDGNDLTPRELRVWDTVLEEEVEA